MVTDPPPPEAARVAAPAGPPEEILSLGWPLTFMDN